MTKIIVKAGTEDGFFAHGRQLAKAADRGEKLRDARIISFEDHADMIKLISTARITLFHAVKQQPGSITEIAERLDRDRSAVKRDIDALERAGLLMITEKVLPGHGRKKEVRALARKFILLAEVA